MSTLPKIEPIELITKYQLHPEIMDIFVEGEFDRDFITQHFESFDKSVEVTILPIDCVNVSAASSNSNKEAVITLATLIDKELNSLTLNSVFIVDADCERINGATRSNRYLHYTDFTCMEMYFCYSSTLRKFLRLTCNLDPNEEAVFLKIAEKILPCLFTARAVNELHTLGISIPNFSAGLKTKGDFNSFDPQKYLISFSSLIGNSEDRLKALNSFQLIAKRLPDDLRHKSHGHDFISLLFEYLWKRGSLKLASKGEDIFRFGGRILGTALDKKELLETRLFQHLHSNYSRMRQ
jgi:hypothetical protein